MKKKHDHPIDILLVEDNEGDARLAMEAFRESTLPNKVHHVHDGIEAMAYLRKEGTYTDAPRPHLILLDLNLPRKGGMEVLAEIKEDEELKLIPVVILTISGDEKDYVRACRLQANCFFTKPIDFEQFLEVVRAIEGFWKKIARNFFM
jgi:two-component system, chemotaxis family, response regulator Rcp1